MHKMELAYQLFTSDLERLNLLLRNTDILREDHIVSVIAQYILNQQECDPEHVITHASPKTLSEDHDSHSTPPISRAKQSPSLSKIDQMTPNNKRSKPDDDRSSLGHCRS